MSELPTEGRRRLERHAAECEECVRRPLPLDELDGLLSRSAVTTGVSAMSSRVLDAAAPLLADLRERTYRRRLVASLLLSLAPLPAVAFFSVYMLSEAYSLLVAWLPGPFVAGLLVAYGAMLLLLCSLTYAALPLMLARDEPATVGVMK